MAEYIEKEAVVHHFMTKRQYLTKDLVMDAAYEVSKFPAADVAAVVHGTWKRMKAYCTQYVCSECGDIWPDFRSNYCPGCGARMDGAFQNGNNHEKDWPSYMDLPRNRKDGDGNSDG